MIRKRFALIFTLLLFILATSASGSKSIRGSGTLITESRSVSDFDHVVLSGTGNVVITQGGVESLTVETDDNIMPHITTEVRGGTLHLGFSRQVSNISPTRLIFTLNVKDLSGMKISGSGEITADSLDTDRLDVKISGSGEVRIESLTAKEVKVHISGFGEVEVAGETAGQDITISGSGNYRAGDLYSETADITISGSGDATVWAAESLEIDSSGSAEVSYYGNPRITSSSSGSEWLRGWAINDHQNKISFFQKINKGM